MSGPPAQGPPSTSSTSTRKACIRQRRRVRQVRPAQLQRGFQVYKEVCAACHGLSLVAFRDLHALGYSEAEKAIADQRQIEVPSINPDTGEPATRKAPVRPTISVALRQRVAARAANNNAIPPDLSLMTKARHDGAAYVYSLLTGYAGAAGGAA